MHGFMNDDSMFLKLISAAGFFLSHAYLNSLLSRFQLEP